jgi:hypothetical protein
VHPGTGLQIKVLCQNVRYPVTHLNPESFHVVPVLPFLHHRVPSLGIDSRIEVNALRLDPGLEAFLSRMIGGR